MGWGRYCSFNDLGSDYRSVDFFYAGLLAFFNWQAVSYKAHFLMTVIPKSVVFQKLVIT